MTFDLTINVPTIVSGVLAIIGLVAWLVRLEGKADNNAKTTAALEGLVALLREQFQSYRLEAAEKYVTQAAVTEIKRDLGEQMAQMERRIETAIDRAVKAVQGN